MKQYEAIIYNGTCNNDSNDDNDGDDHDYLTGLLCSGHPRADVYITDLWPVDGAEAGHEVADVGGGTAAALGLRRL